MASESEREQLYDGPLRATVLRGEVAGHVARLVLVGKAASSKAAPARILGVALEALRHAGTSCRYLVTPAGLIKQQLRDEWVGNVSWSTTGGDWDAFAEFAKRAAEATVHEIPSASLSSTVERLVLGVDIEFRAAARRKPVGQAAVVWDVVNRKVDSVTGKSYPQSGKEEARLIRNNRAGNHRHAAEAGVVYVCHDLVAFRNPRNTPKGDRRHAAESLRATLDGDPPKVILHLAHTTDRAGTWTPSWNRINATTDALATWATAFRYRTKKNRTPKKRDGSRNPITRSVLRELADPSVTTVVIFDPRSNDLIDIDYQIHTRSSIDGGSQRGWQRS